MNAGKSTLAKQLAKDLGRDQVAVHVDDYRRRPVPDLPYLQTLDLPELAAHLDDIRQDCPTRPVIIEGICLREVLYKISRKLDLAIYVEKLSQAGLRHTQFDLEDFENDPRQNVPKILYDDEMRYHRAYRPHVIADLYFERQE